MSILYKGPSKDASYQVLIHLARWFQRRRFFRNRPIRNKNGLWRPCLLMDRDKMSILYKEPSIDASYQVSVHLAEGFQRRRLKCEKLTTPSDGKSSHCLWQGELKMFWHSKHDKDCVTPCHFHSDALSIVITVQIHNALLYIILTQIICGV